MCKAYTGEKAWFLGSRPFAPAKAAGHPRPVACSARGPGGGRPGCLLHSVDWSLAARLFASECPDPP